DFETFCPTPPGGLKGEFLDVYYEVSTHELVEEWLSGVAGLTREGPARIASSFARWVLPGWEAAHPGPNPPLQALQLCEAWLREPSPRRVAKAEAVFGAAREHVENLSRRPVAERHSMAVAEAGEILSSTALCIVEGPLESDYPMLWKARHAADVAACVARVTFDAYRTVKFNRLEIEDGCLFASTRWIYDRVVQALVPWILATGTPGAGDARPR
ncbi:hypothetical protein OAX78_04285, partial [Planctomycetota bacterium]|nr:hypothetical protein [Planctomycetota bacterium]